MEQIIEIISRPWPWYIAGTIIALVMFLLLYLGNSFGISSNLRTVCSAIGAGKHCEFFDFNWRSQIWNLTFAAGMILGGLIAHLWLTPEETVHISKATVDELKNYGIQDPGEEIVPSEIFKWETLGSLKGFVMLVIGGFFVGFGTRYAGGCTSGHAISGLSDLQLPSLIAVAGFFIGGLFVTYLIMPVLLGM